MRLQTQLVVAAENIEIEENLCPVETPAVSKDTNEQQKPAQKVVGVVDQANRKICVILLRYKMDKGDTKWFIF